MNEVLVLQSVFESLSKGFSFTCSLQVIFKKRMAVQKAKVGYKKEDWAEHIDR